MAAEVVDVDAEAEVEDDEVTGESDVVGLVLGMVGVLVGCDVGGGGAAVMGFWGSCGARAGSGGIAGLMEGGVEELRRLPRDEADGDVFFAGFSGGVYCVPASTVVFEERVDVDKEVREVAMVGLERPGNATAGGRRM